MKTVFFEFPTGLILYLHTETNFGSGVVGVIAGFIYHSLRAKKYDLGSQKWFKFLFWLNFPLTLIFYFSCFLFMDQTKPSLAAAIFGAFSTTLWAFMCAIFILGMAFNVNHLFRELFANKLFLVLGQLSYSVYLTHMYVIILGFGMLEKEFYTNKYFAVS